MYRKIIVGYDDSEQAKDALALGRDLKDATGAELVVAGVAEYDARAPAAGPGVPPPPSPDTHESLRAAVIGHITQPAEEVGGRAVAVVSTSAARGLEEVGEEAGGDLIVVGSCHRGRVGRILAGSVGERLLHGSPCAVAVAPVGFAQRDDRGIRAVGVGFEGNPEAAAALRAAATLAKTARATLRIVAVVRPEPVVYGKGLGVGPRRAVEDAVRESLEERVDWALGSVAEDVTAEGSVLRGDPVETLGEQDVDLMVVGSRRYGPVRTVLLGGVSLRLIRSAACPVLVVPRGAASPKETARTSGGEGVPA